MSKAVRGFSYILLVIQQWQDAIHISVSDRGGSHNKSLAQVFMPGAATNIVRNGGNYGQNIMSLHYIRGTYVKRREDIYKVEY